MKKIPSHWRQIVGELIDVAGVFATGGVVILAGLTGFSMVMAVLGVA